MLQFGYQAADLPALFRQLAAAVESLGDDAEVLDVAVRPQDSAADAYFIRH